MSWFIPSTNIKFSNIQTFYNNVNNPTDLTNPISLSEFKGCEYVIPTTTTMNDDQQTYITPGSYTWTCPTNVTSVSVVCCGGGGGGMYYAYTDNPPTYQYAMNGGGGGGLGWKNNISVTPQQVYSVVVGGGGNNGAYPTGSTAGGQSYFISTSTVSGGGGGAGRYNTTINGGTYTGDGGGNGGRAFNDGYYYGPAGGGGAGGYSGSGGDGRQYDFSPYAGSGGGGAGGRCTITPSKQSGGGGGVGYLGEGNSGTSGSQGGGGGSSGWNLTSNKNGGEWGGGGGGASSIGQGGVGGNGGGGFVRIIWGDPGTRVYPNTNTHDSTGTFNIITYAPGTIPTTGAISLHNFKTIQFTDMRPNMEITSSGLNNGDTTSSTSITLTFTSTEPTHDFVFDDITINMGTLENFQSTDGEVNGGHKIFTATLTFDQTTPPNSHTINVSAGVYTNSKTEIGSHNIAAPQYSITWSSIITHLFTWNHNLTLAQGYNASWTNSSFQTMAFGNNGSSGCMFRIHNSGTGGDINITGIEYGGTGYIWTDMQIYYLSNQTTSYTPPNIINSSNYYSGTSGVTYGYTLLQTSADRNTLGVAESGWSAIMDSNSVTASTPVGRNFPIVVQNNKTCFIRCQAGGSTISYTTDSTATASPYSSNICWKPVNSGNVYMSSGKGGGGGLGSATSWQQYSPRAPNVRITFTV